MTSISNPTHHMLNNRHSAMYCWWSTWRLLYVPSRHGSITKGEIKSSAHCISIVQLAVNSFTRHIIGNFGDHFTDQTTQPTASHLWRTTVTVVKTISSANPTTLKGKIKNVTTCLGGAVGSVAVRATVIGESGFEPGPIIVSGYSGACFETKFSGRHRGFYGVLFNLICDSWLILGLETLSISHCLNHW